MTDRTPVAFVTALVLHGLVVALVLLFTYSTSWEKKIETKPFELVAGEGDNFAATEAPALGVTGGIKLNVPTPPAPTPEPIKPESVKIEPEPAKPEPIKPEPVPVAQVQPAPKPPTVPATETTKAPPKQRTMAEEVRRKIVIENSKVLQKLAREKAAEKKRLDLEKAEEAKRAKAAAQAPRVDAEGIAKGVLGGSTANKEGGAGGKALSRMAGSEWDDYVGELKARLKAAIPKQSSSDILVVKVEFRMNADGSLTNARILQSSANPDFDRAVLIAFANVRMRFRPDGKSTTETMVFRPEE
jgi:colicin import membrane protein